MKRNEQPLHPALEALIVAIARRLARDYLDGKLPDLDTKPVAPKRPALRVKRKAA